MSCKRPASIGIDGERGILTYFNIADIRFIDFCHDLFAGQVGNPHNDSRIIEP